MISQKMKQINVNPFQKIVKWDVEKIVKSYLMKQKGQIGTQRLDPNAV